MIAYLPCELKGRDLDSRILIAAHLCQRGVDVIVGNLWGIVSNLQRPGSCPPGVVLFATSNKTQARMMAEAKKGGHTVVGSNEEALAIIDKDLLLATYSPEALNLCDLFLLQNHEQEKLVSRAHPNCRGAVVGNARIDLLYFAREIYGEELSAITAAGPYVLFNTSLTAINPIDDTKSALERAASAGIYNPDDPAAVAEMQQIIEEEKATFESLKTIIQLLRSDLPEYRFVVRPHPAENPATWRELPGVEVVEKSNGTPWILGASALVHANSTTGFEAAILGVPALNIGTSQKYIVFSANLVEPDPDKATVILKDLITSGAGPLSKFAPRQLHYPKGAASRIAEKLYNLARRQPDQKVASWGAVQTTPFMKAKISVSAEEFMSRTARILKVLPGLKVGVQQIDDTMFLVQRQ